MMADSTITLPPMPIPEDATAARKKRRAALTTLRSKKNEATTTLVKPPPLSTYDMLPRKPRARRTPIIPRFPPAVVSENDDGTAATGIGRDSAKHERMLRNRESAAESRKRKREETEFLQQQVAALTATNSTLRARLSRYETVPQDLSPFVNAGRDAAAAAGTAQQTQHANHQAALAAAAAAANGGSTAPMSIYNEDPSSNPQHTDNAGSFNREFATTPAAAGPPLTALIAPS